MGKFQMLPTHSYFSLPTYMRARKSCSFLFSELIIASWKLPYVILIHNLKYVWDCKKWQTLASFSYSHLNKLTKFICSIYIVFVSMPLCVNISIRREACGCKSDSLRRDSTVRCLIWYHTVSKYKVWKQPRSNPRMNWARIGLRHELYKILWSISAGNWMIT